MPGGSRATWQAWTDIVGSCRNRPPTCVWAIDGWWVSLRLVDVLRTGTPPSGDRRSLPLPPRSLVVRAG